MEARVWKEEMKDSLAIDKRLEMYRQLYLIRQSEQYIVDHYYEDEMKTPMHMSQGQEAIPVGVLAALGDRAQVFSSYRTHAAYLARTDDVEGFFAELYGKETGPNQGRAGSMHISNYDAGYVLASGVVATQIPIAVGAAYANKRLGNDKIAVVFFGDGATNEGAFWESLNAACLYELPVLFVHEDNGLAVHTHKRARDGHCAIEDVVTAYPCLLTMPSRPTDAETICRATERLIQHMSREGFPGFLHCPCYRYLEHVGVNEDYNDGYRDRATLEQWQAVDPVVMLRAQLAEVYEPQVVELEARVNARIQRATKAAQAAAFADAGTVTEGVYS
jgi:TPP-dependent pyruvate/acetoin dehydrogenase alpha subunit